MGGRKMGNRKYRNETRAQVLAALLAGQSVRSVAKEYRIPQGTVATWKRSLNHTLDHTNDTQKKEMGELIIDYLRDNLTTLRTQLRVFGDATWLAKQAASEAAVLHGVLADKGIRLLEALAGDEEDSQAV